MMTPTNRALGLLLIVQLLLTGLTWWPDSQTGDQARDLIATDAAQLKRITIRGDKGPDVVPVDPLVLERRGADWVITSADDYPATIKLEELFENLDALVVRSPVATQAQSHAALDVSADQHSRFIEVEDEGGTKTTFYMGSSSGTSSHVRMEGEDDVYKIRGFTAFALNELASFYFDREFIKVAASDVTSMTIARPGAAPIVMTQIAGEWTASGVPPDMQLDQAAAKDFVHSTLNVRMMEPHGTQVTPEMGFDDGIVVSWTATTDGASSTGEYRVGRDIAGESGRVYLKYDQAPWVVEVLKGNVQHATERTLDAFLQPKVEAPPATP